MMDPGKGMGPGAPGEGDPGPGEGVVDPLDRVPLRFVVGPTAAGKSALSLSLAESLGAEIVSLDSMTIYRGMDIGTAKPGADELARVPHHLIDIVDPDERFDLRQYLEAVRGVCSDLIRRGSSPLFVGGTGLYLAAVLRGLFEGPPADLELRARLEARAKEAAEGGAPGLLHGELEAVDPAAAAQIHVNDLRRTIRALEVFELTGVPLSVQQREWGGEASAREARAVLVGVQLPTEVLDQKIAARTAEMLDEGWPQEALSVAEGPGFGRSASQALGYDTALALARGEMSREEAEGLIALRTRQFARRQRTWYRKFPIQWFDPREADTPDRALKALRTALPGPL